MQALSPFPWKYGVSRLGRRNETSLPFKRVGRPFVLTKQQGQESVPVESKPPGSVAGFGENFYSGRTV